jgi:hypothetical protein
MFLSTNYNDNLLYLLLEPVLFVVRVVEEQEKFYVGEVVVQLLGVVVEGIVEDLFLLLQAAKGVVVVEPQVVSGEIAFQIYESPNME